MLHRCCAGSSDRAVDARRAHPALGQMQLVAGQILGRGGVGRSPEKGGEALAMTDIGLLCLLKAVLKLRALCGHGGQPYGPTAVTPSTSNRYRYGKSCRMSCVRRPG